MKLVCDKSQQNRRFVFLDFAEFAKFFLKYGPESKTLDVKFTYPFSEA